MNAGGEISRQIIKGVGAVPRKSMSVEGRENQLIALATDLAEKRLREGTASSQEIVHFLKLGSERERLEREKLLSENKLLKAKTESIESSQEIKELYAEAIKAMKGYSPE
jgi:hypothetical protein